MGYFIDSHFPYGASMDASTQASPSREKAMPPHLAAALSGATLAFRDMAVGLGARLLEIGDDPATWALIDQQLPFVVRREPNR